MASSNVFLNVNGESFSPCLREILGRSYQVFHHVLNALEQFLRIIYCIFIDFPLFICSYIATNCLDRYPSIRSNINVFREFLCSAEQKLKNFGRYIFDSIVVKTATFHLENHIKVTETILKRLLRVTDHSVMYRCHRCEFLTSVSAQHDYSSEDDETVRIRDYDLANGNIPGNCISDSNRENPSTSLEKEAIEKKSSETADDANKYIETTDVNKNETADGAGNDIETMDTAYSEDENTDTIQNDLTNVRGDVEGLEKFFILFYTILALHPINTYLAALHFIRNVTSDINDYCQKLGPVTSSGRKIVSPHRMIRSRFILQLKKMTGEIVNLTAADDRCKLILADTGDLIFNFKQSTSRKRNISLAELDARSSSSEDGDPDYVPEIPSSDLESESIFEDDFSSEEDEIQDCEVLQDTHAGVTQTDDLKNSENSNNAIKYPESETKMNDIKDIVKKMNIQVAETKVDDSQVAETKVDI